MVLVGKGQDRRERRRDHVSKYPKAKQALPHLKTKNSITFVSLLLEEESLQLRKREREDDKID